MSYNNNNPPGRCIIKHHVKYGNIYMNTNKYNNTILKLKIMILLIVIIFLLNTMLVI